MDLQRLKSIKNRVLYGEHMFIPTTAASKVPITIKPVSRAWVGLECVIQPIIDYFDIDTRCAIEFGVEYGYSTSVFANYFDKVYGIDLFIGDVHAGFNNDLYRQAKENLNPFANVYLIKSSYQDYQSRPDVDFERFNLAHVDIVHTYEDTFACGFWALNHSDIVLFHDTQSFKEVKCAVRDLASKFRLKFYNYPLYNGLGILVPKEKNLS